MTGPDARLFVAAVEGLVAWQCGQRHGLDVPTARQQLGFHAPTYLRLRSTPLRLRSRRPRSRYPRARRRCAGRRRARAPDDDDPGEPAGDAAADLSIGRRP